MTFNHSNDPRRVKLGAHDYDNPNFDVEQIYEVEWIIIHEEYDLRTHENDIAIIKLNGSIR